MGKVNIRKKIKNSSTHNFYSWKAIVVFSIILITLIIMEIIQKNNCINIINIEGFSGIIFAATTTVVVLSLTVLSILLNADYEILGISFKVYSKYEMFPLKYKNFFTFSAILLLSSLIMFVLSLNVALVYIFIISLFWIWFHTNEYYRFMTDVNKVIEFLIKDETILMYGPEIETYMINRLLKIEDMLSGEAKQLIEQYKIVKEKRRELGEKNAI